MNEREKLAKELRDALHADIPAKDRIAWDQLHPYTQTNWLHAADVAMRWQREAVEGALKAVLEVQ